MRRTLFPLALILLLVMPLVPEIAGAQAGNTISHVSPETNSARKELEQLQKQNGLTVGFVEQRGRITFLSFRKRDFIARSIELSGHTGAVARDGHLAAVWRAQDPVWLAIVDLDGTVLHKYPGVLGVPECWSYDSSRLILERELRFQVLDVASGEIQTLPIVDAADSSPINSQCWAPDGKQIVYAANDGYVSVYDLANRNFAKLVKGTEPTWSPDGNWIAYQHGTTHCAIRPSGEGQRELFHKTRVVSPLYWSPDSRFVVYSHEDFIALDVEFYHLIARRLADGSEDMVADAPNVASGNLQWVQSPQLIKWFESKKRKR